MNELHDQVKHSAKGKNTRQTEEEVGRQHQGMDRPGVRQVPEGSGEQGKMGKIGCKIICGAPTTLAVLIDGVDDDDDDVCICARACVRACVCVCMCVCARARALNFQTIHDVSVSAFCLRTCSMPGIRVPVQVATGSSR